VPLTQELHRTLTNKLWTWNCRDSAHDHPSSHYLVGFQTQAPDLSMYPMPSAVLILARPPLKTGFSGNSAGITSLPILSRQPHFQFSLSPTLTEARPSEKETKPR
jgi:hypothetical protein